jgi:hypothetical protein
MRHPKEEATTPGPHPDSESGFVDAKAVAKHFGVRAETIMLWARRGLIPQFADELFDLDQVAGRIRRASRESHRG